jgi:alpha-glucuronidase
MKMSRREFVAAGLAAVAGGCVRNRVAGTDAEAIHSQLPDEDGYKLWLRYAPPGEISRRYLLVVRQIRVDGSSATCGIIRDELCLAATAMLGSKIPSRESGLQAWHGHCSARLRIRRSCETSKWTADLSAVGDEGFIIRSVHVAKQPVTVIASNSEIGALYGTFHFLRLMQTGQPIERLDITERPALQLRLMNHWDNPNGTIERGYAGRSLWQWNELPATISPRYAITPVPAPPSESTAR